MAFTRWNCAPLLLVALAGMAPAADKPEPPAVRAVLQSANERKPAPEFALEDASGKTVSLKDYRGKVVLLDFWATWCTGCKKEIPWFSQFQETYGPRRFAVVGVSLDSDGWKVLKPFLADAKIPYQIVLGNDDTAKLYEIEAMPDTFLIDPKGRVAAAYRGGLVDRANIEANIKTLLKKR